MAVGPRGVAFDLGIKRLLYDDRKDDESFWGQDRILVNTTTGLRTWWTQLIWISHVMNTTDMDFARDKHDWYGKISSVLLSTHAHMFVLRVKVQYTIIVNIKLLLSVLSVIPGNITSSMPGIVYECVARVNNAIGNERVMFPWYYAQNGQ